MEGIANGGPARKGNCKGLSSGYQPPVALRPREVVIAGVKSLAVLTLRFARRVRPRPYLVRVPAKIVAPTRRYVERTQRRY